MTMTARDRSNEDLSCSSDDNVWYVNNEAYLSDTDDHVWYVKDSNNDNENIERCH